MPKVKYGKMQSFSSIPREIAIGQLQKLHQIAETRVLTHEEVKSYDVLVKNLRMIDDEQNAQDAEFERLQTNQITTEELLLLATEPTQYKVKDIEEVIESHEVTQSMTKDGQPDDS